VAFLVCRLQSPVSPFSKDSEIPNVENRKISFSKIQEISLSKKSEIPPLEKWELTARIATKTIKERGLFSSPSAKPRLPFFQRFGNPQCGKSENPLFKYSGDFPFQKIRNSPFFLKGVDGDNVSGRGI
jgi:hypothetical protein